MCGKMDLGCHIQQGFQSVLTSQFDAMLRDMNEAALASLHSQSTFWINLKSPTVATGSGQDWANTGTVAFLQEHVVAVSAAIFTLAILAAGIRIAWEQRAEPLRQLLKATMLFALVSAAGSAVLQLLILWSDEFSKDLVTKALPAGQTFEEALGNLVMGGGGQALQKLPILLALFSGTAALLSSLIQIVLLLIRSAMLVLLAGTFPLAAAATNTEVGMAWFKKFCGWALAFVAYKPAAALIYAAAIRMSHDGMTSQTGDGLVQVLTGLMMLALAIVALPALLRFTVPITAAAAGGNTATGSSAVDPGGLASGAINVARPSTHTPAFGAGGGSGSGGGVGGGGGSRPTGASGAFGAASGAIGAATGAASAALTATKSTAAALSGAASHSTGEPGGGSSPTSTRPSGSSASSSARPTGSSTSPSSSPSGNSSARTSARPSGSSPGPSGSFPGPSGNSHSAPNARTSSSSTNTPSGPRGSPDW